MSKTLCLPPPPRSPWPPPAPPRFAADAGAKNVVLVHGGFVDGSGWQGVYNILKKDGYNVTIVQNPTTSLADDVAVTKRAIAQQDGPVVLVGHSYGGVVVSEAGTDQKVKAVVYIAAFAPDKGESVPSLIANPPAGAPVPPILPPHGWLPVPRQGEVRRLVRRRRRCRNGRPSWPTRRFRGASRRWPARSPSRPGRPSRASIWLPPTTA